VAFVGCSKSAVRSVALLLIQFSGLILEGALGTISRDKKGFGVMIFPDSIFKHMAKMAKHNCRPGGRHNRLISKGN